MQSSILISGGNDWKIMSKSSKRTRYSDCYITKLQTIGTASRQIAVASKSWNPIQDFMGHHLLFTNQEELMMLGNEKCKILKYGRWFNHSKFNESRWSLDSFVIEMPKAIFLFGTDGTSTFRRCYEYLLNGSHSWSLGEIPDGDDFDFWYSFGLAISPNELLIMGGKNLPGDIIPYAARRKIMKFNVDENTWTHFGNLRVARYCANAVLINNKIIISGGNDTNNELTNLRSTEIMTLHKTKSHETELQHTFLVDIREGGDWVFSRRGQTFMGLVNVENKTKLIIFGGDSPIEEWDEETESWHSSNLSPPSVQSNFGYYYKPQSLNF